MKNLQYYPTDANTTVVLTNDPNTIYNWLENSEYVNMQDESCTRGNNTLFSSMYQVLFL